MVLSISALLICFGFNLGMLALNLLYKKYHIVKINVIASVITAILVLINFIMNFYIIGGVIIAK